MQEFLGLFNVGLISAALRVSTPLIMGGLSYAICAQAGVVDMALEGKMLFGAFLAMLIADMTKSQMIGVMGAALITAIYGGILGVVMVKLHGHQTVVGIGSNFLMQGFTAVFLMAIYGNTAVSVNVGKLDSSITKALAKIPVIGVIFQRQTIIMLVAIIAAVLISIYLRKTKSGLRLRSIGENPAAADSLGLNVHRTRILACVVAGFLCGLGGADLSVGQLGYFGKDMVSGRGYIALSCGVVGRYKPIPTMIVAMLVALIDAFQVRLQTVYNVPPEFFQIIPYLIPIIVIVLFGGVRSPGGFGKPFRRGER